MTPDALRRDLLRRAAMHLYVQGRQAMDGPLSHQRLLVMEKCLRLSREIDEVADKLQEIAP